MKIIDTATHSAPRALRATAAAAVVILFLSATPNAGAQVPVEQLAAGAPTEYTVVRDDTLWAISGKFLKSPWMWPQLWAMNKTTIRNPHWIYPGNVLRLEISNGQATLTMKSGQGALGELRLKPGVRIEDAINADDGVTTIPMEALTHFLTRPMIIDVNEFGNAPRVLAVDSGRIFAGAGTKVYGLGLPAGASGEYSVYREGAPMLDPVTKELLAYEAIDLGTVRVIRSGDTALLEVLSSNQEISKGDRLLPIVANKPIKGAVQSAPQDFSGRILKVFDGKSGSMLSESGVALRAYARQGGALSIVVLNKGAGAGLTEGQVLNLNSTGATVGRHGSLGFINGTRAPEPIQLPNEANGHAVLFKVFDKVSYALVMSAKRPILTGDDVTAP